MNKRWLLLPLLFLMPHLSFASAGLLMPPGTDKSLEYLGMVFGAVGGLPLGSGSVLFSQIAKMFNQVILIIGFMIVAYTTLVSAINTAQEGEVMGKKWSIIWVPVRVAAGLYLLMPSATGYSYIQIFVMWFIVNGIGLADKIWDQVIAGTIESGVTLGIPTDASINSTSANSSEAISNILKSRICANELNESDKNYNLKETIVIYRDGDIIGWGYPSTKEPICGFIPMPNFSSFLRGAYENALNLDSGAAEENKKQLFFSAIDSIDSMISPAANEALNENDKNLWVEMDSLGSAAAFLDQSIVAMTTTSPAATDFSTIGANAHKDGWLFAGSYYFKLVAGAAYQLQPPNITTSYQGMKLTDQLGSEAGTSEQELIDAKATAYMKAYADSVNGSSGPNRPTDNVSSNGGDLGTGETGLTSSAADGYNAIFGTFFSDLAMQVIDYIHSAAGDPIVSMGMVGSEIVMLVEGLLFLAAIGVFMLQLVAGLLSCCNPLASSVDFVIGTLIPTAIGLLLMTWTGGMMLAIYVPLIPYLVFTFAAFAWFFLVIEALIGAPLIALGLIIPSEDEIGKAAHGAMLIMAIFLRPPLMIVGFVLGSKLLYIGCGMLNFGFSYVLLTQITGIGMFGAVAVIILYSGLCLAIVHECFSMIFIVPDKVMTWMGGQAEHSKVMDNVKQAKGYADKGASVGAGAMKGGIDAAGKAGNTVGSAAGSAIGAIAMA